MTGRTITGLPECQNARIHSLQSGNNNFIFEYLKSEKFHGCKSKLNDEDFWKKVCEEKTTLRESQQRNSTSFNRGYYQ